MKFKSGHLNTFPILSFAANHPFIPGGKNPGAILYTRSVINKITDNIPELSGWYFWGVFDQNSNWENLYIGKSENRGHIASLKYRIRDELKEERICFWAFVVGDKKAFLDHRRAFDGRYDKYVKRALRKKGATFIIWVSAASALSTDKVKNIERGLINYYKPLANTQRNKKSKKDAAINEVIKLCEKEKQKILNKN